MRKVLSFKDRVWKNDKEPSIKEAEVQVIQTRRCLGTDAWKLGPDEVQADRASLSRDA